MAANIIALLVFIIITQASVHGGDGEIFTANLIHRDYSTLSPYYDPFATHEDRIFAALNRSIARQTHFNRFINSTTGENLYDVGGAYLVKISVGTPPFDLYLDVDTGSSLIWTQCLPCTGCDQTRKRIVFNSINSSTYKTISCKSPICTSTSNYSSFYYPCEFSQFGDTHKCQFGTFYGGGGFSTGDLVTDTFLIGSAAIPGINFGCGHDNGGPFWSTASGILGLGANPLSLVRQLQNLTNGRFAHCFANRHNPTTTTATAGNMGKIKFGQNSFADGPGVVSTPFLIGTNYHYALTLDDVTVGNSSKSIQRRNAAAGVGGNIIIDSGSTYTHLPKGIYEKLELEIIKDARTMKPIDDPSKGEFNLCFKNNLSYDKFSPITFHFSGGGDVVVRPERFFVKVHDLLCLNIFPVDEGGLAIFGNSLQVNMLVGYDLIKNIILFKPTDCTQY